ncbi:MAG TPA: hypothetical protein VMW95_06965, partial [Desulfobacterales bacterium]|nr:hypothetical protein [Desulfobacterales bacterium]
KSYVDTRFFATEVKRVPAELVEMIALNLYKTAEFILKLLKGLEAGRVYPHCRRETPKSYTIIVS